jgi:serine/threonine protein kinase/WD40 repeat protein/tetratricopeptide (TPR) repeat protein
MPPFDQTSNSQRNPVELLAEEFVERQRRGEYPSITEYTTRHPELAQAIRELFPALAMIEQLKPAVSGRDLSDGLGVASARPANHAGESLGSLGEYRLIREIARGGMGVVYEALQESLGRHVALKVLPRHRWLAPSQIERFQLEARSAARLHHGHIVSVYGVGEHDGVHYYAMQFIHGHGLDKILEDLRRLRGLSAGSAAPSSRADRPPATSELTGSQTLALSLLRGAFGHSDTLAERDRRAEAAAGSSPTHVAIGPDAERLRGSPVHRAERDDDHKAGPASRGNTHCRHHAARDLEAGPARGGESTIEPDPTGATSSLSLVDNAQFYRSAARIGLQVADALAYAHAQGVLHRDIKPSNLLLDAVGNVWVTDFGLAKLEGSEGPTRTGDIVGTVRYMAPERFDRWSDRRSDVYSLGATLYELLTLRPLFSGVEQAELIERVLHAAPERPRRLDPGIPRDLETIVTKAIAKEPGDRYPTAAALGEDLKRFLEDRPVLARRSTPVERSWRWCRRNPLLAGASIAAAAAILMLAVGAPIAAWTYRHQLHQIRGAQTQMRQSLVDSLKDQARAGRFGRRVGQRFESLRAIQRAAQLGRELNWSAERFDTLRDEAIACLALPDLKPTGRVIHRPPGVVAQAFDAGLTRAALRFRDGSIHVRRLADDQDIARFHARGDRDILLFGFSPDGRYLVTQQDPDAAVTVWDIETGVVAVNVPGAARRGVRFTPDSLRIAMAPKDDAVHLYELATGRNIARWPVRAPGDVAFSWDGTRIAVISVAEPRDSCLILDVESGRLVRSIPLVSGSNGVAWSPDGTTLATSCDDWKVYLWATSTGARTAVLAGHSSGGVHAAFHPAGALVASNGWEGRLWLWDPVLGRSWLAVAGESTLRQGFSRDGRLVVPLEDRLTTYEVEPALEYRTLAHFAAPPISYERATVARDGRLLALGTSHGTALFDLAKGSELAFLPIDNATHSTFEPSGDLLTSGALGVWRWPIQPDRSRGELRIGPPRRLPLPAGGGWISEDGSGQIVSKADFAVAEVITPARRFHVGPLADGRSVAVSPDGQWLATGSHGKDGAHVWRMRDGIEVAHLVIDGLVGVFFSPDGRWLLTTSPPCRLWTAGTWREAREVGGRGICFSRDGSLLAVQDASAILRLVEPETGRTLARLESPDLCGAQWADFSPDGSLLVIATNDGPAVHVWDLRAIRRRLAAMGLDWDAPPLPASESSDEGAPGAPALKVTVDFGPLKRYRDHYESHLEQYTVPTEELIARHSERLRMHPDDVDALHGRGHALLWLRRFDEALADFSAAAARHPLDVHLRAYQGICLLVLDRYTPALDLLEQAFQTDPENVRAIINLDALLNKRAWTLATAAEPRRKPMLAARLAALSVALAPGMQLHLNTLGVAFYRTGRTADAIQTLEKSLAVGDGRLDGWDLFFLAMAHHRLGHREEARACLDRACHWVGEQNDLSKPVARELAAVRAEAESLLSAPGGELPADVFARPR